MVICAGEADIVVHIALTQTDGFLAAHGQRLGPHTLTAHGGVISRQNA